MVKNILIKKWFVFFITTLFFSISLWVGISVKPTYFVEKVALDVLTQEGRFFYVYKDKQTFIDSVAQAENSPLWEFDANKFNDIGITDQVVQVQDATGQSYYWHLSLKKHFSFWSLVPAILTLLLCWLTREPVTSLLAGVVSGALILGQYNLMDEVLIPSLMSKNSASMILIYLFLLGGLLGLWAKTGAAKAFAQWMTDHFVRGPRSA